MRTSQRIGLGRRRAIFADVVEAQDAVPPGAFVRLALRNAKERVRELYGITPEAMEKIVAEGVALTWFPLEGPPCGATEA